MEWLNYHHLQYFWMVAREGSVTRASRQLRLAQPTVSGQIRTLEAALGEKLFHRKGRTLVLTDVGRVAFRYADEIFGLGRELVEAVRGRGSAPTRLIVGVGEELPKPIVRLLLEPALHLSEPVRLVCREDRPLEDYLAELATHTLDVVLSDAPAPPGSSVRAFSHLLGECGTTFFAAPELAAQLKRGFPASLNGAPCLLPGSRATLRRGLDQWLHGRKLRPNVIGEFDDPALMNVFGQDGVGIFPGPSVIERELRRLHNTRVVGRAPELRQRFYALSVERRLKHPAVVAISESARQELFA